MALLRKDIEGGAATVGKALLALTKDVVVYYQRKLAWKKRVLPFDVKTKQGTVVLHIFTTL